MQTRLLPEDAENLLAGLQARDIPGRINEKCLEGGEGDGFILDP